MSYRKLSTLATRSLLVFTILGSCMPTTSAYASQVQGSIHQTTAVSKTKQYFRAHPKVKSAAVGAGVGTAAGALTGMVTGRGIVRGAAIGAGTGAGVGLISSSQTMKRHPIMKDAAIGAASGLGLAMAANRGYGSGRRTAETAAIGAALGLGVGFYKEKIR